MRGYVKGNREISIGLSLVIGLLILVGGAYGDPISSCVVISSPGSYVLQNDIINSTNSTCIEITSSDVTFDGAGYMIDGMMWEALTACLSTTHPRSLQMSL